MKSFSDWIASSENSIEDASVISKKEPKKDVWGFTEDVTSVKEQECIAFVRSLISSTDLAALREEKQVDLFASGDGVWHKFSLDYKVLSDIYHNRDHSASYVIRLSSEGLSDVDFFLEDGLV